MQIYFSYIRERIWLLAFKENDKLQSFGELRAEENIST
jgi:hypothetical protein